MRTNRRQSTLTPTDSDRRHFSSIDERRNHTDSVGEIPSAHPGNLHRFVTPTDGSTQSTIARTVHGHSDIRNDSCTTFDKNGHWNGNRAHERDDSPPVTSQSSEQSRSKSIDSHHLGSSRFPSSSSPENGRLSRIPKHSSTRLSESSPIVRLATIGTSGSGRSLPFHHRIQSAFGRYDISSVRAHQTGKATSSARAIVAAAYTYGEDVVLASSPDLHTVAHEAAHVIQQRVGAVPKCGINRENSPYERHADEVARAVSRGISAEPILDRIATQSPGRDGTANQSTRTIALQRKVGFEFDTNICVDEINDDTYERVIEDIRQTRSNTTLGIYQEAYQRIRRKPETDILSKNTPLHSTSLYTLVADSKPNAASLEFVTNEFDTSPTGMDKLQTAMQHIAEQLNRFEQTWKNNNGQFLLGESIASNPSQQQFQYRCTPFQLGNQPLMVAASPQMTTAIRMEQLNDAISTFRSVSINRKQLHSFLTPTESKHAETSIREAKRFGLINLIRAYLTTGQGSFGSKRPLGQFKHIAGPLLARTSFSRLFSLLHPDDVTRYRENPELFVKHVLAPTSGVPQDDRDSAGSGQQTNELFDRTLDLFHRSVGRSKRRSGTSIEKWLFNIPLGIDMLRHIDPSDRDSLSDWGDFTEEAGPLTDRQAAPVFEYRGDSTKSITTLVQWTLNAFKYAMILHGYPKDAIPST